MTTPYDPPENLLERLRDPAEVTSDHIYAYLKDQWEWNLDNLDAMAVSMDPFGFFEGDRDLEQYRAAMAWWPNHKDVPQCPTLVELCNNFNGNETFLQRLRERADLAVAAEDATKVYRPRQPVLEGETKEEHKARLNRARVQRHRFTHGSSSGTNAIPAVREAYMAYLQACADRKAAIVDHTQRVANAKEAWDALRDAKEGA